MARRIALGVVIGVGLLLVLDAAVTRAGVATGFLPRWESTAPWITSRAAGVSAFLALTLDVVFGLFVSTRIADRWIPRARAMETHRWLSSAALTLTAVHALALVGDRYVRFDAFDVLVPFLSAYRAFAVGLGVLAAYAALMVHASFRWRRELGGQAWRRLHALSFFAYGAALLHGLFAGSDTGAVGMRTLYLASATAVGALVVFRAYGAGAPRAVAEKRGGERARSARARRAGP